MSLSVCFPEALRSLIIAVKSTAKQLSKGKHRQRKRGRDGGRGGGGGGEGEGEREVESYSRMEERGVMSSKGTKGRNFEID